MAKQKKEEEKTADKKSKKKGKKKKNPRILLVPSLLMAAIFLPSTLLLAVGMLPTFVAFLVDRSRRRTKGFTVGAINLSGCAPFLMELWLHGHTFEKSFSVISDPKAIVVMYSSAAVGYLIDWAMSGIVSSLLYQKGISRQKAVEKQKQELIERWGEEVTGRIPLDEYGFPIQDEKKFSDKVSQ